MSALMEVTLASTYANQVIINRWNYVAAGTPAAVSYSFALASAFGAVYDAIAVPPAYPEDTVLGKMRPILSSGVVFQSIEVRSIYSVTDFYTTGFIPPYGGAAGGEALSPVMAFGFRSSRVRADIRRATKRFAGVPEAANAGAGVIAAAYDTGLGELAQAMSDILQYDDEGNTLTFSPAVCKKQRYTVPDSSPVRYAYRYIPEADGGLAAQLNDTATGISWEFYSTLRSQTSRQYGRGI